MIRGSSPRTEALIMEGYDIGALPHVCHLRGGVYVAVHNEWCGLRNGGIECTCFLTILGVDVLTDHTYILVDKRKQ